MKRPRILVVGSINMDLFRRGCKCNSPDTENLFDADIMVMELLAAKALIRPLPLLNREQM